MISSKVLLGLLGLGVFLMAGTTLPAQEMAQATSREAIDVDSEDRISGSTMLVRVVVVSAVGTSLILLLIVGSAAHRHSSDEESSFSPPQHHTRTGGVAR